MTVLSGVKKTKIASIEDTVDALIQLLKDYIEKHERGLIATTKNDTDSTIDKRMTTTRKATLWPL